MKVINRNKKRGATSPIALSLRRRSARRKRVFSDESSIEASAKEVVFIFGNRGANLMRGAATTPPSPG